MPCKLQLSTILQPSKDLLEKLMKKFPNSLPNVSLKDFLSEFLWNIPKTIVKETTICGMIFFRKTWKNSQLNWRGYFWRNSQWKYYENSSRIFWRSFLKNWRRNFQKTAFITFLPVKHVDAPEWCLKRVYCKVFRSENVFILNRGVSLHVLL